VSRSSICHAAPPSSSSRARPSETTTVEIAEKVGGLFGAGIMH
jgi:hypothetical protein